MSRHATLQRQLGLSGSVMLGLGLIVRGWCWHGIAQRNRKVTTDAA